MATKVCPNCTGGNGLNIMKGEVTQLISVTPREPQLIEWTCGFCGYQENEEIVLADLGGGVSTVEVVLPPEPEPDPEP